MICPPVRSATASARASATTTPTHVRYGLKTASGSPPASDSWSMTRIQTPSSTRDIDLEVDRPGTPIGMRSMWSPIVVDRSSADRDGSRKRHGGPSYLSW